MAVIFSTLPYKYPDLLIEHDRIIQGQLQKGITEPVKETQSENLDSSLLDNEGKPIHYIPHHAVICQERATTKIHIVYDKSAKIANLEPSINKCLQTGPNLYPSCLMYLYASDPIA